MFLKVSPWKKILRFGRKRKLSPRFIGPYEILERVGPVAYCLALPLELAKLHDVFHVSMLRRYRSDPSHILPVQDIQVQEDFTFDEEPKAKKIILLKCPDLSEVTIQGIRSESVPKIMSAMKARRFLRKGCEAFLALILDSKREQVNLENIPVIREFPDVFPEELPGVPPEREVDLSIEVAQGTTLIRGHLTVWLQLN